MQEQKQYKQGFPCALERPLFVTTAGYISLQPQPVKAAQARAKQ